MTETIRDKKGRPLGYLFRIREAHGDREDICAPEDILQASFKTLVPGHRFRMHRHLPLDRGTSGTAEAWIVIIGAVLVTVGEEDGSPVREIEMGPGDCFVRIAGSHGMVVLEAGTMIYELKNGPYYGQNLDKEWVE